MSSTELDVDSGWDQARWVTILDRIEFRDPDVGLRFWGPPLWLEVTMVGPDSDAWPTITDQLTSWDWQSDAPCVEVAGLIDEGVDDDRLLSVVARYTIENLILNAVHEIGEWFRFDGRRPFPAHLSGGAGDGAGNGAVSLCLGFGGPENGSASEPVAPAPDDDKARRLSNRLAEVAAPSRFTYLPGTRISYGASGPVILRSHDGRTATVWQSMWSASTMNAFGADDLDLVALATQDVHLALVSYEVQRICGAFHVDGHRPWSLSIPEPPPIAEPVAVRSDHTHSASLSVSIAYSGDTPTEAQSYPPVACLLGAHAAASKENMIMLEPTLLAPGPVAFPPYEPASPMLRRAEGADGFVIAAAGQGYDIEAADVMMRGCRVCGSRACGRGRVARRRCDPVGRVPVAKAGLC